MQVGDGILFVQYDLQTPRTMPNLPEWEPAAPTERPPSEPSNHQKHKKLIVKYHYPTPTKVIVVLTHSHSLTQQQNILLNISHAMAVHRGFYTQVLHLMNRLNLPPPFGPLTPQPPMVCA